jgi:hypothetical protein
MNLLAEFEAATEAVEPRHFDVLVSAGVPRRFLYGGAMRFGIAAIETDGDLYEPSADGVRAFIMPAQPLLSPGDADFEIAPDIGDLVAWFPREPHRWFLRCGSAPLMNPAALEAAAWFRRPLSVESTPLDWLRAEGRGIVILDGAANLRWWLSGIIAVHADSIELGEQIDGRLRDPRASLPRVMVREAA